MFHRVPPPHDIALRASLHRIASELGARVMHEAVDGRTLRLHLSRGEHLLELSGRSAAVGEPVWTLTALRAGAAAELSVRPELAGESFDKLLGMTLDLSTGDPRFDARFVVEAAPAAVASHLLNVDLRACLMALPRGGEGPRLRITAGSIALTWSGTPQEAALRSTLHAVFECLDRCRALHEAIESAEARAPFRVSGGAAAAVDPRSRDEARARIGRARRRAAAFLATSALAAAAFLASTVTVGR